MSVFFYSCAASCAANPIDPWHAVYSVQQIRQLGVNGALAVSKTGPFSQYQAIRASLRIGFRESTNADFFLAPGPMTLELHVGSAVGVRVKVINNPGFRLGVPRYQKQDGSTNWVLAALDKALYTSFDDASGLPLTRIYGNHFGPTTIVQLEDGSWSYESTDATREYLFWSSPVGSGLPSHIIFLYRRSDLVVVDFHGENYLVTPEVYSIVEHEDACTPVSEFGVLFNLFAYNSLLGYAPPNPSHDRVAGRWSEEAYALLDYRQVAHAN